MTANELRAQFNNEYGLGPWPKQYEVDAITYANCCQAIFDNAENDLINIVEDKERLLIWVGRYHGLLFKGVELILMGRKI